MNIIIDWSEMIVSMALLIVLLYPIVIPYNWSNLEMRMTTDSSMATVPVFSRAKSEARWLVGGHLVPKVGHLTLFHASRMYRINSSCCEIGRLCGCCCCCPAAVAYRALLLLCAPTDGELPALWLLYPGELDAPATELLLWWWW